MVAHLGVTGHPSKLSTKEPVLPVKSAFGMNAGDFYYNLMREEMHNLPKPTMTIVHLAGRAPSPTR